MSLDSDTYPVNVLVTTSKLTKLFATGSASSSLDIVKSIAPSRSISLAPDRAIAASELSAACVTPEGSHGRSEETFEVKSSGTT